MRSLSARRAAERRRVRRSEYSGFGAKQDKTQPCHYRSEKRTLRKARKAVGERRVQDQRSRFARAVFLGALESHERAHPPYPIGQGLAEQSSKQGRQVLRRRAKCSFRTGTRGQGYRNSKTRYMKTRKTSYIRSVPYRTGISRHGNRVREILFSDLCLRFARTASRARWTKNSCCCSTSITTSRATARKTRRRFGNICWKGGTSSQRCAGLSIPCSLRRTRRLHRISRKSMRICSSLRTTAFCLLTSENDLDILNMDEQPNAVFIIVPDERFTRHRFVTLFITQMYKELVEKANLNNRRGQTDTAVLRRNVYYILDEWGNLPKFENIEGMVTVARSRGIRFLFVLQSFSQLTAKYGREIGDIVKANCNVKIFIGSDDPDTRESFRNSADRKKSRAFPSIPMRKHRRRAIRVRQTSRSSRSGCWNASTVTKGRRPRVGRGYEPIWSRFTPSYKLKSVYFKAGRAEAGKREAVLFDKSEYVFDITGGKALSERDKMLDVLEKEENAKSGDDGSDKERLAEPR